MAPPWRSPPCVWVNVALSQRCGWLARALVARVRIGVQVLLVASCRESACRTRQRALIVLVGAAMAMIGVRP